MFYNNYFILYIWNMKHYTITYGDTVFEASEYQDKIFDNVKHGSSNMIISAAAGASKTTTIVNCMNIIPENLKVLFIAFNRDIVKNIKDRIEKNKNANVMTFHSLGYSILRENNIIKHEQKPNEFKYRNYIKGNIDEISDYHETKSLGKNRIPYLNNITNLVEYCRYYLAFTLKEIEEIAKKYGIVPYRDEISVTREVLKWGKNNLDTFDYTDMIWLPNVLNLTTRKHIYDWILIDEAQDTSISEQKIVDKCFGRGSRFIAVGDDHQKINVWCGASEEAIDNFKKYGNVETYKLPISYRCPKKIVELASKFSDNIIAAPNAIDGEINYDVSPYDPKNGDMVLCRTTAPLVELHLRYNRINKKSYIRGNEKIREQYEELIERSNSTMIDKNFLTSDGLFPKLYRMLFDEVERVQKTYGLDEGDAYSYQTVLNLYDNIAGISAISEGLTTVDELKEKIKLVFNGEHDDAIQLSTVHKAKGLEADNIYILLPSLLPSKLAKKEWEKTTERNLIYVAITRAKKTLNYIDEEKTKWCATNGAFDIVKMRTNIKKAKEKINYNIENNVTESYAITGNTTLRVAKKLGERTQMTSPNNGKKKKGGLGLLELLN